MGIRQNERGYFRMNTGCIFLSVAKLKPRWDELIIQLRWICWCWWDLLSPIFGCRRKEFEYWYLFFALNVTLFAQIRFSLSINNSNSNESAKNDTKAFASSFPCRRCIRHTVRWIICTIMVLCRLQFLTQYFAAASNGW